jgi:hypothetical protein
MTQGWKMDEALKAKLEQTFAAHAEKQARASEVRTKVVSAQDQFLQDFEVLSNEVIRPAMIEIGEFAKERGLSYRIEAAKESTDHKGAESQSIIGIVFIEGDPDRYRQSHEYAGWSAHGDKRKLKVWFHQRTMGPGRGGMAGGTGEYPLSDVTKVLVQAEVVKVLTKILA